MSEPVGESVNGSATLPCRHVVVRNPRRTIGLVWLGALRITAVSKDEDGVFPLSSIVSGYQTGSDRTAVLHLTSGAQLVVRLESDEPARILAHAGVGVARRALTLPLRGQFGAFTIGFVAVWALLFSWWAVAAALHRSLGGYAFLGIDDYERVLADAATPPDQRIGAALALRAIDPEQGSTRIRVAADGLRR